MTGITTAVRKLIDVNMHVKILILGVYKKKFSGLEVEFSGFWGGTEKLQKMAKNGQKSLKCRSANFRKMAQNPVSILSIFPEKTAFCCSPR